MNARAGGSGRPDVRRVLICARGALAPRLLESYRERGLETVIAFGPAEAEAAYLEEADFEAWLGEEPAAWSDASRAVSAALDAGCDGVHPGLSPLACSLDLCSIAVASNLGVIGIDAPRAGELLDAAKVRAKIQSIGLPLAPEAQSSDAPEVAVVIAADRHGTIVPLGGLLGSESPLAELGPSTASSAALDAAQRAARALLFAGVGSVVLRDGPSGPSFVRIEPCLPRAFELVELVHGVDLIDAQLRIALGGKLGWSQEEASGLRYHGLMAFLSAAGPGTITDLSVPQAPDGATQLLARPGDTRLEGADLLLATASARAPDPSSARAALRAVLQQARAAGIGTDIEKIRSALAA